MYLNKKTETRTQWKWWTDRGTIQQTRLHYLQLVVHKNDEWQIKTKKQLTINKHISEKRSLGLYGFFKVENPKFRPMSIKLSVGQIRPSKSKKEISFITKTFPINRNSQVYNMAAIFGLYKS